jgi:HlyD family secretion protein
MNVVMPPPRPAPLPIPAAAARIGPAPRRRPLALWIGLALLGVLGGLALALRLHGGQAPQYVTEPVVRATLVQTVTAEGTVNPQNLILVGTQISGTIAGLDVDYNSAVHAGQVMAKIDPTTFRDAFDQAQASETQYQRQYGAGVAAAQGALQTTTAARANAAAARAALDSAASQVAKARVALDLARLTLRRDTALLAQGYVARNQYDTDASSGTAAAAAYAAANLAVDQARAQLRAQNAVVAADSEQSRSATAAAAATQAQIGVYRAQADQASYNLRQTVIVSPVEGTVIARNVSVGQTVAASFQTPTLFTIAQDLSKMEVDIAVGEPDIGGIRSGNVADFTVLAYPNRVFHGTVYQVRRNPTSINNVVTYDTVVYVENRDGALYPGMTANASIHVAKVDGALVVPVETLQWSPSRSGARSGAVSGAATSQWGMTAATAARAIVAGRNGRVFVLRGGTLQSVPVRVLLVSGTQAAVAPLRAQLAAGDRAIVADQAQLTTSQTPASSALTRSPTAGLGRSGGTR